MKSPLGLSFQTHPADEIVIADDGSKEDTRRLIESFKDKLPIKHVWHEDNGFQKSRILNSAILASESDYLIFTDQDCIPRKDFIATHAAYAERVISYREATSNCRWISANSLLITI